MATFMKGDMWRAYNFCDLFLITANSTVTTAGKLVMGRGIAKQAKDRFPGLDEKLGTSVALATAGGRDYFFLISKEWPEKHLGLFQVKRFWGDKADLNLIYGSTKRLAWWLRYRHNIRVCLNYPGIGNGGLRKEEVRPILEKLPNNVQIYYLED